MRVFFSDPVPRFIVAKDHADALQVLRDAGHETGGVCIVDLAADDRVGELGTAREVVERYPRGVLPDA